MLFRSGRVGGVHGGRVAVLGRGREELRAGHAGRQRLSLEELGILGQDGVDGHVIALLQLSTTHEILATVRVLVLQLDAGLLLLLLLPLLLLLL